MDRFKLRRTKERVRAQLKQLNKTNSVVCLAFDGRKDETMLIENIKGRNYRRVVKEEHEPGGQYLGHISTKNSTASHIATEILKYFQRTDIDTNFDAILCDGCPTNTGKKSGIIKTLELNRPLQWMVCQFHTNELLLNHLFKSLDGPTNSDTGFTGITYFKLNVQSSK